VNEEVCCWCGRSLDEGFMPGVFNGKLYCHPSVNPLCYEEGCEIELRRDVFATSESE
jgi:hypothetical protein